MHSEHGVFWERIGTNGDWRFSRADDLWCLRLHDDVSRLGKETQYLGSMNR